CNTDLATVTVYDRLRGELSHEALWCWNLHPSREVLGITRNSSGVGLDLDGVALEMQVQDGGFQTVEIVPALTSPRYGQVIDTWRLEARVGFQGGITVQTRFRRTPRKQNGRPVSAQR